MAIKNKFKKVKKVTEIPNATVTIEVEEKEAVSTPSEVAEEEVKEKIVTDSSDESEEVEEKTKTIGQIQDETEEALGDMSGSSDGISWKKILLVALIVIPLGIGIFVGIWVVSEKYQVSEKKAPAPTSAIEKTPSPTESKEVNKTEFEIEVLNGSGISGEAATVQELLEDDGFVVSGIGNAQGVGVTKTIIASKEDVSKSFIDALQETLEKRGPVETEELDEDETSDVIVTVGSETSN